MTNDEFQKVLNKRILDLQETLSLKGMEYGPGIDRLQNFKDVGAMNDIEPEYALWGMVSKHIIALKDFVTRLNDSAGMDRPTRRQIDEKIGDIIAYMNLLDGLFVERGI